MATNIATIEINRALLKTLSDEFQKSNPVHNTPEDSDSQIQLMIYLNVHDLELIKELNNEWLKLEDAEKSDLNSKEAREAEKNIHRIQWDLVVCEFLSKLKNNL